MKNPITLEAFASWCEQQPPNLAYQYLDNCNCAFAQYLNFVGVDRPIVGSRTWSPVFGPSSAIPPHINEAVGKPPYTFGALALRLREAAQ